MFKDVRDYQYSRIWALSNLNDISYHIKYIVFIFVGRFVAYIEIVASLIAAILIVVACSLEIKENITNETDIKKGKVTFENFCKSSSIFLFAYGGAALFPTIQHDMKKPENFKYSVIIAYSSKWLVLQYVLAVTQVETYQHNINIYNNHFCVFVVPVTPLRRTGRLGCFWYQWKAGGTSKCLREYGFGNVRKLDKNAKRKKNKQNL